MSLRNSENVIRNIKAKIHVFEIILLGLGITFGIKPSCREIDYVTLFCVMNRFSRKCVVFICFVTYKLVFSFNGFSGRKRKRDLIVLYHVPHTISNTYPQRRNIKKSARLSFRNSIRENRK